MKFLFLKSSCFLSCLLTLAQLQLQGQSRNIELNMDSILQKNKGDTIICLTIREAGRVPFSDSTLSKGNCDVKWRKIIFHLNKGRLSKELYSCIYPSYRNRKSKEIKWSFNEKLLKAGPALVDNELLIPFIRQNIDSFRDGSILPFITFRQEGTKWRPGYEFLPGSSHGTFYSLEILWSNGVEMVFKMADFSEFQLAARFDLSGDINLNYPFNQADYFKRLFDLINKIQPLDY